MIDSRVRTYWAGAGVRPARDDASVMETSSVGPGRPQSSRGGGSWPRTSGGRAADLYSAPMLPRRKTRQITVGDDRVGRVRIGGDAPIAVQTMTAGYTHEVDACVAEIERYAKAGADVVRVAVP